MKRGRVPAASPMVKRRSVEPEVLLPKTSVPLPKIRLEASLELAPMSLATPPLPRLLVQIWPESMRVEPV